MSVSKSLGGTGSERASSGAPGMVCFLTWMAVMGASTWVCVCRGRSDKARGSCITYSTGHKARSAKGKVQVGGAHRHLFREHLLLEQSHRMPRAPQQRVRTKCPQCNHRLLSTRCSPGAGHAGTFCPAPTQIPDSGKESRCPM